MLKQVGLMDIIESTRSYEAWLGDHIPLIPKDLITKHQAMRQSAFRFLRATFYRWMQLWPQVCPELVGAPAIFSVGDLHLDNLGTWRDVEGRLVWGINDFDEADVLPYTVDLVRLAASAILAYQEKALSILPENACQAILSGYWEGLENGGMPFVLAENHPDLHIMAMPQLHKPDRFWQKLNSLPSLADVPADVMAILRADMQEPAQDLRYVHRTSGLGSLGRQRYMAIATVMGGKVAREAKRLVASACRWARGDEQSHEILYQVMLDRTVRDPDPFTHLAGDWLIRRIAPDCSRIDLVKLSNPGEATRVLTAMGWETANIHLGSGPVATARILANLKRQSQDWLLDNSQEMVNATLDDWEEWKKAKEIAKDH
jgi:hypothetical protein